MNTDDEIVETPLAETGFDIRHTPPPQGPWRGALWHTVAFALIALMSPGDGSPATALVILIIGGIIALLFAAPSPMGGYRFDTMEGFTPMPPVVPNALAFDPQRQLLAVHDLRTFTTALIPAAHVQEILGVAREGFVDLAIRLDTGALVTIRSSLRRHRIMGVFLARFAAERRR